MNCKVCGTRLGILERWRYGDFCSQDHREIFAHDLAALDKKLVSELFVDSEQAAGQDKSKAGVKNPDTKQPARQQAAGEAVSGKALPPEQEPAPEPDPPMAGFLPQGDAAPCAPAGRGAPARRPSPERTEKPSEVWRTMAKLARLDEPPVASLTLKGRELPSIVVEAPAENPPAPGGFVLPRTYAAISPPAGAPVRVQGMPQAGLTMPPAGFWGPGFAVAPPVVPYQPSHWVDDEGWHWISDAEAMMAPTVDNVLSMYPMAAPWTSWPLAAPGAPPKQPSAPMTPPPSQYPGPPAPGSAFPSPSMAAPTIPSAGMPGPGPGAPGPMGTGFPSQPVRPAGFATGPAMPRAGLSPGPPAPHGAGVGGGNAAAFGGQIFGPPSLGAIGLGVAGGLFGGGNVAGWGPPPSAGFGPLPQTGRGYMWRELPPPFFSALVDLSFGMKPADEERAIRLPLCPVEPAAASQPECPALRVPWNTEFPLAAPESPRRRGFGGSIPPAAQPPAVSVWSCLSSAFPQGPGLPRPRVPRRTAPAVILPLGSRLGLPKPAEPLMATGAGLHGGRVV